MKRFFFLFLLFSTGAFAQNSPVAVADQTFRINGVHEFARAFAESDQIKTCWGEIWADCEKICELK